MRADGLPYPNTVNSEKWNAPSPQTLPAIVLLLALFGAASCLTTVGRAERCNVVNIFPMSRS